LRNLKPLTELYFRSDNDEEIQVVRKLFCKSNDLKKMKVKGWIQKMKNREQWRLVVEEVKAVKAHPELQRQVVGVIIMLFVCFLICSNVFFLQCLPLLVFDFMLCLSSI
jgi:hypothetical protein